MTAVFSLSSVRSPMRVRDMSHVASDFRTALSKCDHLVAYGKHKEAFDVMVKAFVVDRTRRRDGMKTWKLRKWSDMKEPIAELFRLAFSVRNDGGESFHEMWQNLSIVRDNMRGNPNAEDIWTNVTKEIRANLVSLIKDAQARAAQELASTSSDADLVSMVSGRTREQIISSRYSVDAFVASVISRTLQTRFIGVGAPMLRLALDVAESFSAIVTENKLTFAAQSLTKALLGFRGYLDTFLFSNLVEYQGETGRNLRANELARNLRESRTVFQEEIPLMERTFDVCLVVVRAVQQLSLWQSLSDATSMTTRILVEFLGEEGKKGQWPMMVTVYKALADVFLKCNNRTFHALCLIRAASAQCKIAASDKKAAAASAALSTIATLAALAAPDISERRNQFGGNDQDFKRLSEIAEMFKLAFPPSRSTLCNDLRSVGALGEANAAAKELFTLLTSTSVSMDVCTTASNLLEDVEKATSLTNFEAVVGNEIRRFVLTRFFFLVAEGNNSMHLNDAKANVHLKCSSEESYATVLSVLLDELSVPVLIDQGTSEVTFTSASLLRMHNTFSQLAQAAQPPRTPASTKRQPLPVSLDELELETNRLIAFHALVKDRVEATGELKKKRAKNILQQRETKKQAIITEEMLRQKAQQEQNMKRMAKEYQQAELKERRKLLIHRLQEKHKGLKVNPDIVELNQQSFMDNLTAALTEFQRRLETVKRADVRRMDHFERACREKDIPKRQEIAQSMAAQLEAESKTRWENFLHQHRAEYDEKQATRTKLQKFLLPAEKFEKELQERTTKTTKRDEQEELLRAEKARLAQASEAPATPATEAPAAAPAPAKWQPKPKN